MYKNNIIEKKGYSIDDKICFRRTYDYLINNNYIDQAEKFKERLETLTLRKVKNEEIISGANYNINKNTITYFDENDLFHETLHVASLRGIGILDDDKKNIINIGINEGITDLYNKKINGNVKINYPLEKMCAELIEEIYDYKLCDAYFRNNLKKLIETINDENIFSLLDDLDDYNKIISELYSGKYTFQKAKEIYKDISDIYESIICIIKMLNKKKNTFTEEEINRKITEKISQPEMKLIMEIINIGKETNAMSCSINELKTKNK